MEKYGLTYVSSEDFAVPEDPEEVGDEEGAQHQDGGEQRSVGASHFTLR